MRWSETSSPTPDEVASVEWFRVYNSIKDDPKILGLTPENRWFYVALLAVSSEQKERGSLPNPEDLAISLRVRRSKLDAIIDALRDRGLIDCDQATKRLTLHGWSKRQRRTDDVAARVSKHRETHRKRYTEAPCNVTETLPHARATDTDTETETEKREIPPYPPLGVVSPEPEAKPLLASTPKEIERVAALATAMLSDLTAGDVWITHCVGFAQTYPAAWVEMVIPGVASKLRERHGGFTPESWARRILKNWTKAGEPFGPLARASPGDPGDGMPGKAPGRPATRPAERPLTEHQKKMAAIDKIAYGPLTEEERRGVNSGGLGDPGDGQACEAIEPPRRAYAGR